MLYIFLPQSTDHSGSEDGGFPSRPSSAKPLEEKSVRPGELPPLYKRNGRVKMAGGTSY